MAVFLDKTPEVHCVQVVYRSATWHRIIHARRAGTTNVTPRSCVTRLKNELCHEVEVAPGVQERTWRVVALVAPLRGATPHQALCAICAMLPLSVCRSQELKTANCQLITQTVLCPVTMYYLDISTCYKKLVLLFNEVCLQEYHTETDTSCSCTAPGFRNHHRPQGENHEDQRPV